jgi:hypothetical protein
MHCSEIGLINFNHKKYLLLHTNNGCGWHFFDWSLQYLSGKDQYYKFANQQWLPISHNPLHHTHSHLHQINFVHSIQQLEDYNNQIDHLRDQPVVLQNGINLHSLDGQNHNPGALTLEQRQELDHKVILAITRLATRAQELGFKLITLNWSPEHQYVPVYQIRQAYAYDHGQQIAPDLAIDNWLDTFFPGSDQHFDQHVWDRRELVAVNMRVNLPPDNKIDLICQQVSDIVVYTTRDLWYDAQQIFDCNHHRVETWQLIYSKWQKLHDTQLSVDYEKILDAIVAGKSMDLGIYKLDFLKEALIQHGLIYRHNLNLKNWQLEHFPNDTLILHHLLEPNIHDRDPAYCNNLLTHN